MLKLTIEQIIDMEDDAELERLQEADNNINCAMAELCPGDKDRWTNLQKMQSRVYCLEIVKTIVSDEEYSKLEMLSNNELYSELHNVRKGLKEEICK